MISPARQPSSRGSTAGIGYAIAKGMAQAGTTVVVNGRTAAAVERTIAKLNSEIAHANIRGVAADVGTADGCATLVVAEPLADILVNNVGIYGPQDFLEIPDSEWTHLFEVNVMSGVRLSRAYLPGMLQRNWGRTGENHEYDETLIISQVVPSALSDENPITSFMCVSRTLEFEMLEMYF